MVGMLLTHISVMIGFLGLTIPLILPDA